MATTYSRYLPNLLDLILTHSTSSSWNIDRDMLFRKLLAYGAVVAAVAAPLTWFVFVVLGVG